MPSINVILKDMPVSVREAVTKNEDDSYSIFINSRLSINTQETAYTHALEHIKRRDFESTLDVQVIEYEVHKETEPR